MDVFATAQPRAAHAAAFQNMGEATFDDLAAFAHGLTADARLQPDCDSDRPPRAPRRRHASVNSPCLLAVGDARLPCAVVEAFQNVARVIAFVGHEITRVFLRPRHTYGGQVLFRFLQRGVERRRGAFIGLVDPCAIITPVVANHTKNIRELNDAFRTTLTGGKVVMTRGVIALGAEVIHALTEALQSYDNFNDDNDPYGEHDFGVITIDVNDLVFKIDYYNLDLSAHSSDPANPAVTTRVLTIMLAEEY